MDGVDVPAPPLPEPVTIPDDPVRVRGDYDAPSRWLWLVKWCVLAAPHYPILILLYLVYPSAGEMSLLATDPVSLPALEDIAAHRGSTEPIEGVTRIETSPREKATPIIMEMMHSVYPHDEVYGQYITINDYIDCPPDELFTYMADTRCLEEWTYKSARVHRDRRAGVVAGL
jgi:hypothetical protein